MIITGAFLLIPALVILLEAAVSALVENAVLAQPWSALAVGGAALLVGLILALVGMRQLKPNPFVPQRTINQIRQDVLVAKEQVRSDHEQQRAA
jgi:hypothetical protein